MIRVTVAEFPRKNPKNPSVCHMVHIDCQTPPRYRFHPYICDTCIKIFVRSKGATAVFAMAPEMAPAMNDLRGPYGTVCGTSALLLVGGSDDGGRFGDGVDDEGGSDVDADGDEEDSDDGRADGGGGSDVDCGGCGCGWTDGW